MKRITFLALGIVAVFALAFTAASVDSGLQTIDPNPAGDSDQSRGLSENGPSQADDGGGPAVETTGTGASTTAGEHSLVRGLLAVVLLLAGGCAILYGLTGGEDASATESPPEQQRTDDQTRREHSVDHVSPSNDLYRDWLALKEATYPDHDAVTPEAVRTAAVEEGHPRRSVDELTDAFCAVRYGRAELTDDRERQPRLLGEQLDTTDEEHR